MKPEQPKAIPAVFGPNRIEDVWNKPPFERAKPFWDALQWLEEGKWKGIVTPERAQVCKEGILKGIRSTCGDLSRQFDKDGTWRDRKWHLWRTNRTSKDDPQCIYCTGILPPRIACWPKGEPYPTDSLELTEMFQEASDWSFTPAATSQCSQEELETMRSAPEVAFGEFWKKLGGSGNA